MNDEMNDEILLKNWMLKISKPIFDKFDFVQNFSFLLLNLDDPRMWYIDYILEVNGIHIYDLDLYSLEKPIYYLQRAQDAMMPKVKHKDKFIKSIQSLQKRMAKEEKKLNLRIKEVTNPELDEWVRRHDFVDEIRTQYYKVFPDDTEECVGVLVDRDNSVTFTPH
jgi:hypothetical protein